MLREMLSLTCMTFISSHTVKLDTDSTCKMRVAVSTFLRDNNHETQSVEKQAPKHRDERSNYDHGRVIKISKTIIQLLIRLVLPEGPVQVIP